jgi:hypothetical protein
MMDLFSKFRKTFRSLVVGGGDERGQARNPHPPTADPSPQHPSWPTREISDERNRRIVSEGCGESSSSPRHYFDLKREEWTVCCLAHPVLGNVNAGRAKIRRNAVSSNGQIGGLEKNGPDLKIPLFFKSPLGNSPLNEIR